MTRTEARQPYNAVFDEIATDIAQVASYETEEAKILHNSIVVGSRRIRKTCTLQADFDLPYVTIARKDGKQFQIAKASWSFEDDLRVAGPLDEDLQMHDRYEQDLTRKSPAKDRAKRDDPGREVRTSILREPVEHVAIELSPETRNWELMESGILISFGVESTMHDFLSLIASSVRKQQELEANPWSCLY